MDDDDDLASVDIEPPSNLYRASMPFENTRFNYCKRMFEQEVGRMEVLEKKGQFYLTVVTLLLGAIFLKLDWLVGMLPRIIHLPKLWVILFLALLSVLWGSLLFAVIAIVQSIRLRGWYSGMPAKPMSSLFSPESRYIGKKDELSFLENASKQYVLAWEHNYRINNSKVRWLTIANACIFCALIASFVSGAIIFMEPLVQL